jgi:hypothetical protein
MAAPGGNPKQTKITFTYFNHDKGLFMDEKKKRFVDFADMDYDTYKNYADTFHNVLLIKSSTDQTFSVSGQWNMT